MSFKRIPRDLLHKDTPTLLTILLAFDETNEMGQGVNAPVKITIGDIAEAHNHDDRYYTQSEVDTFLSGKQDTLGYTPENVSRKAINFNTVDNILYPTVQAVKTQLDTKADVSHTHTFGSLTSKPTTISGYGITNAYTNTEVDNLLALKSDVGHTHTFASLTSKPTTISGYGITNAYTKTEVDTLLTGSQEYFEYVNTGAFPVTGTTGKLYLDKTNNLLYRWNGSSYVEVSPSGIASSIDWADVFNTPTDLAGYGISSAVDSAITTMLGTLVGAANGIAPLDSSGLVPMSYLPAGLAGGLDYQGVWDGSSNTPAIPAADTSNKGWYYKVSVAVNAGHGYPNIPDVDYGVGDWIVSNGTDWDKIDNSETVSSVHGRTGAIMAAFGDYSTDLISSTTTLPGLNLNEILENLDASIEPRAVAAVVTSSITNGDTDHSPSGDAVFDALALKSDVGHTHTFASLTSKPTTLLGYGITDAYTSTQVDTLLAGYSLVGHTHTFASLTSKPTTLLGYGITDGQPLDSDLTAIAALTPLNDDIIQRKSGAWVNRTLAQLKVDLALASSNISDFTEASQDVIGALLVDSNTIDMTYNDVGNAFTMDVKTQMSITSDISGIKLSGDSSSPGNNKVYGTDASGVKGWKNDPAGGTTTTSIYRAGESISTGNAVYNELYSIFSDAVNVQAVASDTGSTRIAFRVMGEGVAGTTLNLALRKYGTPAASLSVSIQPDSSGSPSGTPVTNGTGTVTAASLTTSLQNITVTLAGSVTLTAGTWYWVVLNMVGDVTSSSNYYGFGYKAFTPRVIPWKAWNGSSWGTGATTTDATGVSYSNDTNSNARGWKVVANQSGTLTSVTHVTGFSPTRCFIKDSGGSVIATSTTLASRVFTFTGGVALTAGTTYRIEMDQGGASYSYKYFTFVSTITGTAINYTGGSDAGSDHANGANIESVTVTTTLNPYIPFISSTLMSGGLMAKTDATYPNQADFYAIAQASISVGSTGSVLSQAGQTDSNQSSMSPGVDQYLTNTPGAIGSTPGTYPVRVGKALTASILEIIKSVGKTWSSAKTDGTVYRAGPRGGLLVAQRTGTNSSGTIYSDTSSTNPTTAVGVATGASIGGGNTATAWILPYMYYKTSGMGTITMYEG